MTTKWISELIGNDYVNWKSGDIVSVSSGTGSGKSYFVQKELADYAKQEGELILYLVPRVKLKEQIEAKLEEKGITNITVKMYQSVEAICNNHSDNSDWLNAYKYIVCDESHYFLNDASFNDYTDMSLEHILSASHAVTLLLSATGETFLSYIKRFYKERKLIEYSLKQDYSYIDNLSAYQSEQHLYEAIDWLLENKHKTIIFIQSDKKAYQVFKKYEKHSTFVCGKHSDYLKFVDEVNVNSIIDKERFDSLFLIATSALDVGVNIKDSEVKHIIIDMLDTDTFIQCLGRKRLNEGMEEKVNVLFRNYTNHQVGGFITKEASKVKSGQLFYGKATKQKKKYTKLTDIFYFDGTGKIRVNNMKYVKSSVNLKRYQKYVQKSNSYLKEIKSLLEYQNEILILDYIEDKTAKLAILEEYADTKFHSSIEAKEVLKKLKLINSKTKKEVKSFSIANREFATQGYPYEFLESKEYIIDSEGQKKQSRVYTLSHIRQNRL